MKTTLKFKKAIKALFILLTTGSPALNAQTWSTSGNIITTTEYFGANATSTIPLALKTLVNQPIEFHVNSSLKASITTGGDINITNGTSIYRIGGTPMLWRTANQVTFVGDSAGYASGNSYESTFLGYKAGANECGISLI